MCNQTASFNHCLFKVQGDMQTQVKVIRGENKGKVSKKLSEAAEELQFLMEFNSSITQAVAKAMEHLTDFVFITIANLALAPSRLISQPLEEWGQTRHLCSSQGGPPPHCHLVFRISG